MKLLPVSLSSSLVSCYLIEYLAAGAYEKEKK